MIRPFSIALLIVSIAGCSDGDGEPSGPTTPLKVMTRNIYLGADLLPVVMAPTLEDIPKRNGALWKTVLASDIPGRAKLIAEEIVAANPDLVGLQEAVVFRKQVPSDFVFSAPAKNATEVVYDFAQLILDELAARGATYVAAASSENADVELPADDDTGARFDVRMIDHDVILVRAGIAVTSPQATRFPTKLMFPVPNNAGDAGVPIDLVRGVARVEATLNGAHFTFADTHLEVSGGPSNILTAVQEGEAKDLGAIVGMIKGPLVLLGDFNSAAVAGRTKSYAMVASKLTDVFGKTNPGAPGFTCCTDIAAPQSMANERIDLIFVGGGARAQDAAVIGSDASHRTTGGLWPSDHHGVVATVLLPL